MQGNGGFVKEYMAAGLKDGWSDSQLTELGRTQALCTGQALVRLLKIPFQFYSSDLLRARETARIIGEILSQGPVMTSRLREQNTGIATHFKEEEAEKMRLPLTDPLFEWIPFPGAESRRVLYDRVARFMERIPNKTDTVLLIVHHIVTISIIVWWLGLERKMLSSVFFDIDPCSITRLRTHRWAKRPYLG